MSSEQETALNYFSELAPDKRAAFMRAAEQGDADGAAAAREPDGPELNRTGFLGGRIP